MKLTFVTIQYSDRYKKHGRKSMAMAEGQKIVIDNRNNKKFTSAAAALNWAKSKATGDWIIFFQEDLLFKNKPAKFVKLIKKLPKNCCVFGLWGKQCKKFGGRSRVVRPTLGFNEVCTIDEMLIGFKNNKWLDFDEETFNSWHCYGKDLCKKAQMKGKSVYTIPFRAAHARGGFAVSIHLKKKQRQKRWQQFYKYYKRLKKKHSLCCHYN